MSSGMFFEGSNLLRMTIFRNQKVSLLQSLGGPPILVRHHYVDNHGPRICPEENRPARLGCWRLALNGRNHESDEGTQNPGQQGISGALKHGKFPSNHAQGRSEVLGKGTLLTRTSEFLVTILLGNEFRTGCINQRQFPKNASETCHRIGSHAPSGQYGSIYATSSRSMARCLQ